MNLSFVVCKVDVLMELVSWVAGQRTPVGPQEWLALEAFHRFTDRLPTPGPLGGLPIIIQSSGSQVNVSQVATSGGGSASVLPPEGRRQVSYSAHHEACSVHSNSREHTGWSSSYFKPQ